MRNHKNNDTENENFSVEGEILIPKTNRMQTLNENKRAANEIAEELKELVLEIASKQKELE